jgi:hypothetical protein
MAQKLLLFSFADVALVNLCKITAAMSVRPSIIAPFGLKFQRDAACGICDFPLGQLSNPQLYRYFTVYMHRMCFGGKTGLSQDNNGLIKPAALCGNFAVLQAPDFESLLLDPYSLLPMAVLYPFVCQWGFETGLVFSI